MTSILDENASLPPGLLRTSAERFEKLPGYPFAPRYRDVGGARMHYVEQGWGDVILCLHGEPTWSYLYRKMIPMLATMHRVIAPDFIGFGRSDKYENDAEYSFRRHLDQLRSLLDQLRLSNITLVCQDWGGLLGLSLVGEQPERFLRLVILNTALPVGEPMGDGFMEWRAYALRTPDMAVGRLVARAVPGLEPEVIAAYDAPFPDARYKAGVRTFPSLVPLKAEDPGVAEMKRAREILSRWSKPALVAFSDNDPVLGGGEMFFSALIPSSEKPVIIRDAGHFLQEQKGEEIAQLILDFIARHPAARITSSFKPTTFW